MASRRFDLAGFVGTKVLPYTNPRVVCPPGRTTSHGRPNIVVATPKRCGTHVLIDTLLNNLPCYRTRPLYVDLDKAWARRDLDERHFHRIGPQDGYILKTHIPIQTPGSDESPRIAELFDAAVVLTVHREDQAIVASMAKWLQSDRAAVEKEILADHAAFWTFWTDRPRIALTFEDLFDQSRMQEVLGEVSERTGVVRAPRYLPPPRADRPVRIYLNKVATRLIGRHAPRIDTTIHTLK